MERQYYYIDYQTFYNVVRWRVKEMRSKIAGGGNAPAAGNDPWATAGPQGGGRPQGGSAGQGGQDPWGAPGVSDEPPF